MAGKDFTPLSGTRLVREFLHVARLVHQATGLAIDAHKSERDGTVWRCRNVRGDEVAECCPLSGSVSVIEELDILPPTGMLDRIADLRRSGLSSTAIQNWLGGAARARDPLREASLCLRLGVGLMAEYRRR